LKDATGFVVGSYICISILCASTDIGQGFGACMGVGACKKVLLVKWKVYCIKGINLEIT